MSSRTNGFIPYQHWAPRMGRCSIGITCSMRAASSLDGLDPLCGKCVVADEKFLVLSAI